MTETERSHMTEWLDPGAPKDYGTGRKCHKCQSRVHRFMPPYYGKLLLCNRCEKACSDSGLSPHRFVGVPGPKKTTRYDLPNLEAIRESRGWTRQRLSREAECSPDTVKRVETAVMQSSTKMAGKLARALGVSVDELRGTANE